MYYREFQQLEYFGKWGAFVESFYQRKARKRLLKISKLTQHPINEDQMRALTLALVLHHLKSDKAYGESIVPDDVITRNEQFIDFCKNAPDFIFGFYERTGRQQTEHVGLAVLIRRHFSSISIDELDQYLLEEDFRRTSLQQATEDATKFVGNPFLEEHCKDLIIDEKFLSDRINARFIRPSVL
jgi:hypothetical protein